MTSLSLSTYASHEYQLRQWTDRWMKRFPAFSDCRLLQGLYAILGPGMPPLFLKKRSLRHLKQLLLIQFSLQKKCEMPLSPQKEPLARIFPLNAILCVAVMYPKQENRLNQQSLIEVTSQKIPTLKEVKDSFYHWESPSHVFCYIELEKMRGNRLVAADMRALEGYLQKELPYYLEETSTFWPYNHEEAFKQLPILAQQISKTDDCPQVSIHFARQMSKHLEFLVYLARPKSIVSKKTALIETRFPASIHLTLHARQEVHQKLALLIEAFSLRIPSEPCQKWTTVNLLHAREFIAKLLEDVIGPFRDYNGGLLETQRNRFQALSRAFSEKIPRFSLFAKKTILCA